MSLNDIKTEIKFGASVAVPKEELRLARTHDLMRYKKDHVAQDLGIKIADEKGWYEDEEGDLQIATLSVYVFTPAELRDYMNAKFKAKLQHMAATEEYLSDHQREALLIQAERF